MAERIQENSFVMIRPDKNTETLVVEKISTHQERQDLVTLYETSFESYFIDPEHKLPKLIHKRCLNSILPTIALIIHHEIRDAAEEIRENFSATATKSQMSKFESIPDQESGLHYVLSETLARFRNSIKKNGLDKAINENAAFFDLIKRVYFELPVMYIFNLIDSIES